MLLIHNIETCKSSITLSTITHTLMSGSDEILTLFKMFNIGPGFNIVFLTSEKPYFILHIVSFIPNLQNGVIAYGSIRKQCFIWYIPIPCVWSLWRKSTRRRPLSSERALYPRIESGFSEDPVGWLYHNSILVPPSLIEVYKTCTSLNIKEFMMIRAHPYL